MQDATLDEQLSTLFGDSRAEWLGKRIFDLFANHARPRVAGLVSRKGAATWESRRLVIGT